MNTVIQTDMPKAILAKAQAFVDEGLAADLNELVVEALSRYLDSHAAALTEAFLHEDVTWGLREDVNGGE